MKAKPLNGGDTRAPIKGRKVTSVFKNTKQGPHYRPGNVRTTLLLTRMFLQLFINLPVLLKLRKTYKLRKKNRKPADDISALFYS
ncbi:MAG: hypothetical protein LBB36_05450, partial [Fibromonadaceae bacterium]|nr:hypothetical protein [Fibromonadaceae bacterium]